MEAKDAAKVLQNLDDEEVQAILFHLSDRKAAEILGNFEPARAATLSRVVLGSHGGEDS
jgi:flagellar motility protein MotE (MotC chaperone)